MELKGFVHKFIAIEKERERERKRDLKIIAFIMSLKTHSIQKSEKTFKSLNEKFIKYLNIEIKNIHLFIKCMQKRDNYAKGYVIYLIF